MAHMALFKLAEGLKVSPLVLGTIPLLDVHVLIGLNSFSLIVNISKRNCECFSEVFHYLATLEKNSIVVFDHHFLRLELGMNRLEQLLHPGHLVLTLRLDSDVLHLLLQVHDILICWFLIRRLHS